MVTEKWTIFSDLENIARECKLFKKSLSIRHVIKYVQTDVSYILQFSFLVVTGRNMIKW